MNLFDTPTEAANAKFDGAFRGRRLSWSELYRLRPDLKPDNDNEPATSSQRTTAEVAAR